MLAFLAGAQAKVCADAVVSWWRGVSGERYTHAQELRYEVHRARFADMPPLVDGAPAAPAPWRAPPPDADADAEWGCNDSPTTLTRERRALGVAITRALEQRRLEESHLPLASPEAYALCALRRWCVALDRATPPDDLPAQLAGLQRWLARAISDLRAERSHALLPAAALAAAERGLRSVRSALVAFAHAADAKRARMRLASAREQIGGCAHGALVAAGLALHAAYDAADASAPRTPAELLRELRAPPPPAGARAPSAWLALLAPIVAVLLAGGAADDAAAFARARQAAEALGAESAPLCAHLRALTRAPAAAAAADVADVARALQTAWLALLELAERVARFERSCAGADAPAPAADRLRTARAQLRAAHAVADVARRSLLRVLRDLDAEAGSARAAEAARGMAGWLGTLVAGPAAHARAHWLANADSAQLELARALARLDALADATAAALHGLQMLADAPEAEALAHAARERRLPALGFADEAGGPSREPSRKRARARDDDDDDGRSSERAAGSAAGLECDEGAPKLARRARSTDGAVEQGEQAHRHDLAVTQ